MVALVPVLFIFWALVIRKMKGYMASLLATGIALIIAVLVYGMPVHLAFLSSFNGAIYGLFPICWIFLPAVFLFNITIRSGQFEIIRHFMASVTSDRRIQALLIAFSFGSFLEGTAGFGAPVAITAAMLAGLTVGIWKSPDEMLALVKGADVFKPKMQTDERERLLAGWHDAVSRTLTRPSN